MYAFLITVHVVASLFLIAVILLQAGRGGGLADSFGGSQMQSMFGTKSASVLTKMTTVCASLFIITCLSIAIFSGARHKSIVENVKIPPEAQTQTAIPEASKEEAVPAAAPEAVPAAAPEAVPAAEIPASSVSAEDIQGGADENK